MIIFWTVILEDAFVEFKLIMSSDWANFGAQLVKILVFPNSANYMLWSFGFLSLIWGIIHRFFWKWSVISWSLELQPIIYQPSTGTFVTSGQFSPFIDHIKICATHWHRNWCYMGLQDHVISSDCYQQSCKNPQLYRPSQKHKFWPKTCTKYTDMCNEVVLC